MALAALGVLAVRPVLPSTPLAYVLGVQTLPGGLLQSHQPARYHELRCEMRKLLVC